MGNTDSASAAPRGRHRGHNAERWSTAAAVGTLAAGAAVVGASLLANMYEVRIQPDASLTLDRMKVEIVALLRKIPT